MSWEQRQDERLENLLGAFAVALGERLKKRMADAAGCSPMGVAALEWLDRGHNLRPRDLVDALEISPPGASQLVRSLMAAGLVRRARYPHDQRQWALGLTELGFRRLGRASHARAKLVSEMVTTIPFPWRLRLLRILERLLARMVESQQAVTQLCRYCDWHRCRANAIEPCPVAIAWSELSTSRKRTEDLEWGG
jgi:DNA-binding MarR family transcriptional regulator